LDEIEDSRAVGPDAEEGRVLRNEIVVGVSAGGGAFLDLDLGVPYTISILEFPVTSSGDVSDFGENREVLSKIVSDGPETVSSVTEDTRPLCVSISNDTLNKGTVLVTTNVVGTVPTQDYKDITSSPVLDGIFAPRETRGVDTNFVEDSIRFARTFLSGGVAGSILSPRNSRTLLFVITRILDLPNATTTDHVGSVAVFGNTLAIDVHVRTHRVNSISGLRSLERVSGPSVTVQGRSCTIVFGDGLQAHFVRADGISRDVGTVSIRVVVSVTTVRATIASITEVVSVTADKVPGRGEDTVISTIGDGRNLAFLLVHHTEVVLAHSSVVDTSPTAHPAIGIEEDFNRELAFPSSPGDSVPSEGDVGLNARSGAVIKTPRVYGSLSETELGDLSNSETEVDTVAAETVARGSPSGVTASIAVRVTSSSTITVKVVAVYSSGRDVRVNTVETFLRDKRGLVGSIGGVCERDLPVGPATVTEGSSKVVATVVASTSTVTEGKSRSDGFAVTREVVRSVGSVTRGRESSRGSSGGSEGITATSPPEAGDGLSETIGQLVGVVTIGFNTNNDRHVVPTLVVGKTFAVVDANAGTVARSRTERGIRAPTSTITSSLVSGSEGSVSKVPRLVRLVVR